MIEKIKNLIKENKNNKKVLNDYVNMFKKLDKSNELYKDNDDFNKLKKLSN